MRVEFTESVLRGETGRGTLRPDQSVVSMCAGQNDEKLFADLGFTEVTLTNVDVATGNAFHGDAVSTDGWEQADAQAMPYPDGAFDWAFVSDGLHHCRSPHRAVTEMWRVTRRGVIVVESRDSLAMRAARRVRATYDYEFNDRLLTTREHGGVDFGPVPNFVYRWTERDFEKLIRTYNPENDQSFAYYYGLALPPRLNARGGALHAARALTTVAPRQGNTFAMIAVRGPVKRYLDDGRLRADVTGPDAQLYRAVSRRRHRVTGPVAG